MEITVPNAIERQNVQLALRIFDRTTVPALEILGPKSSKRLEDAKVISDTNDRRLQWLKDFACWLKLRNSQTTKAGHLTKETFTALLHTVDTHVLLVKDLLDNHKLNYVMLGKFQTDNLEAKFGQYRMLSGTILCL